MNSFGLVTILPKVGISRIVLVHALCKTIYYSQRYAFTKVDVMMTKIAKFSKIFEKIEKCLENKGNACRRGSDDCDVSE